MAFKVDGTTLKSILTTYPKIEIPSYQRDYDWTHVEWEQLLSDLMPYIGDDSTYFMGPINAERRAEGDGIVVADGQQRLTTLLICLAALSACSLGRLTKDIDELLFNNSPQQDRAKLTPRLQDQTPTGTNSLRLSLIADEQIDTTGALSKHARAFNFFLEKLKGLSEVDQDGFFDLLTTRLIFARVVAQDPGAGIKMFERANTRGRPLTFTDKLKSHLIGTADKTAADEVVNNWQTTVSNLRAVGKYDDKTFVNWLATDWYVEEKTLRASEALAFTKATLDANGALVVSQSLLEFSEAIKKIMSGLTPRGGKQCGSLQNIKHFPKFQQLQRLLPAARHLDEDSFVDFAEEVENTICVIAFAKAFPPDVERLIPSMLLNLRGQTEVTKHVKEVTTMLRTLRNDHSYDFGNQIVNGSYGDQPKSYLIALWGLMEQYIENSNRSRVSQNKRSYIDLSTMSVEHILPQSAKARDAIREFGSHYASQNRQRIANLTPLEGGLNYGMEPFSKKVKDYQSSKFHLTMSMNPSMAIAGLKAFKELRTSLLNSYKKWDYANMQKRAGRLYELASLVLDFDLEEVDVETVILPTLEMEAQFPRVANFGTLVDALVSFAEEEKIAYKTQTTLRFLGLIDESESENLELTELGRDLITRTRREQLNQLKLTIDEVPYVNVWREMTDAQRDSMLKKDILEICRTDKSIVRKQVQECLDEWVGS
jgi:hypothetical protein